MIEVIIKKILKHNAKVLTFKFSFDPYFLIEKTGTYRLPFFSFFFSFGQGKSRPWFWLATIYC